MKVKHIAAVLSVLGVTAALPAQAAYNIYKKDGLSVDLHGQVAVEYKKEIDKTKITTPLTTHSKWTSSGESPRKTLGTLGYEKRENDRNGRLSRNSSWIQLAGRQQITTDLSASGTVLLIYGDNDYLKADTANVSLERRNLGSISIGKQWLHTSGIGRSGAFNVLDRWSAAAVRADFTAVPNLHLSAYHSFPVTSDTRQTSNDIHNGAGFSGTYLISFAPEHSLQLGLGYTTHKKNPASSYWVSAKNKAAVLAAEYKYHGLTLAADVGREHEDYVPTGLQITKAKANSWGVRAAYEFTPQFRMEATYGQKQTKRNRQDMRSWVGYQFDTNSFHKTKLTSAYVKAEYDLRDNVTVFGKVGLWNTKNYLGENPIFARQIQRYPYWCFYQLLIFERIL